MVNKIIHHGLLEIFISIAMSLGFSHVAYATQDNQDDPNKLSLHHRSTNQMMPTNSLYQVPLSSVTFDHEKLDLGNAEIEPAASANDSTFKIVDGQLLIKADSSTLNEASIAYSWKDAGIFRDEKSRLNLASQGQAFDLKLTISNIRLGSEQIAPDLLVMILGDPVRVLSQASYGPMSLRAEAYLEQGGSIVRAERSDVGISFDVKVQLDLSSKDGDPIDGVYFSMRGLSDTDPSGDAISVTLNEGFIKAATYCWEDGTNDTAQELQVVGRTITGRSGDNSSHKGMFTSQVTGSTFSFRWTGKGHSIPFLDNYAPSSIEFTTNGPGVGTVMKDGLELTAGTYPVSIYDLNEFSIVPDSWSRCTSVTGKVGIRQKTYDTSSFKLLPSGFSKGQILPTTLEVTFEGAQYEVEFISDGDPLVTRSITLTGYDPDGKLPSDIPTKTGYTFSHWLDTSSGAAYTPNQPVFNIGDGKNPVILNAVWEAMQIVVSVSPSIELAVDAQGNVRQTEQWIVSNGSEVPVSATAISASGLPEGIGIRAVSKDGETGEHTPLFEIPPNETEANWSGHAMVLDPEEKLSLDWSIKGSDSDWGSLTATGAQPLIAKLTADAGKPIGHVTFTFAII